MVAQMEQPVSAWTDVRVRDAWLIVHIILVLAGYAALLLTAVGVAGLIALAQRKPMTNVPPP